MLSKLHYASDGLRVVAYLYSPSATRSRLPVVIYTRGSYVAGDLAPALAPLLRRLARAGFLVLAPQYRGSDGGEGHDELGGADVADVADVADGSHTLGERSGARDSLVIAWFRAHLDR